MLNAVSFNHKKKKCMHTDLEHANKQKIREKKRSKVLKGDVCTLLLYTRMDPCDPVHTGDHVYVLSRGENA